MNVYYDSEKFGLSTFGEIDYSDGCYQFDLTVIWRREADAAFLYADDSGCSCPSPFESTGIDELTVAETLAQLQGHLEERNKSDYREDRTDEIVRLLERAREAGMR